MNDRIVVLISMPLLAIIAIILFSTFINNDTVIAEHVGEIDKVLTSDNTTEPSNTQNLSSPGEKISALALTCTQTGPNGYVIDLRIKNQGMDNRKITIIPPGTIVNILPAQIMRIDVNLLSENMENMTFKLQVDDGTEFQVNSPPCSTGGSSGRGSGMEALQFTPSPVQTSPPPPVPELPTSLLTLAGVFGLLIAMRI